MAQTHIPDLILMDIQLPVMDGYEATRRIRAIPELAQVPIIAVTSYALSGDEAKTREAGCDGYIAKPLFLHLVPQVAVGSSDDTHVDLAGANLTDALNLLLLQHPQEL